MTACLAGAAAGAIYYGLKGLAFAGQFKNGPGNWLGAGLLTGLVGAAIGVTFVGLCALIAGAKLGPRFSYPFSLALFGGLGQLTSAGLHYFEIVTYSESFWAIGIIQLVLASILGEVMSGDISGYGAKARKWAAMWSLLVLLVGTFLLYWSSGQQSFSWLFVAGAVSYASYGGAMGAIGGAFQASR